MAADPSQLKVAKELGVPGTAFGLARVPETDRLFFGSSDFNVYAVDLADEKPEPIAMAGHGSYVTGVAMAGKYLVSGSYDQKLIWWDIESRESIRTVENAHARWIRQVHATPDGKTIASIADDMTCRLWHAESGQLLHELKGHEAQTPHHYPSMLHACTISRDGQWIATGDKVGHIVVWNIADGRQLAVLDAPGMYTWDPRQRRHSIGGIRSLAFSPDGKHLAVGGMDQVGNIDHPDATSRLEVFDWQAGKQTHELHSAKDIKGMIEQLQFHPDGAWLVGAGGGYKGFIQFFDLAGNQIIKEEAAPMRVHGMALNEAGDALYAAGHGKLLKWSLAAQDDEENRT
jgi:WD40 repeat protein